jgi:hypothetical protein
MKSPKKGDRVTVKMLAEMTGYSVRSIQNMAKSGSLPGSKMSDDGYHREYRWTVKLAEWVEIVRKPRFKRGNNPSDPRQRGVAAVAALERVLDFYSINEEPQNRFEEVSPEKLAYLRKLLHLSLYEIESALVNAAHKETGEMLSPESEDFEDWVHDLLYG